MLKSKPGIEIDKISGVGQSYKSLFNRLGVFSLKDLIYFLPKKLLDLQEVTAIAKAKTLDGQLVVLKAVIKDISIIRTRVKHMWIVEAILEDSTGSIMGIWYNQPFMQKNLKKGQEYVFYGAISVKSNKLVINNPEVYDEPGLYPIYPQTKGLTSKVISKVIKKVVHPSTMPPDLLPKRILKGARLPGLYEAAKLVHQPRSVSEYKKGRYRFLFEELFMFSLINQYIKNNFDKKQGYLINSQEAFIKGLIKSLPFELTKDQVVAFNEVATDLKRSSAMNRIIQGDVGSGKTVVAFLACCLVAKEGLNCVFMAPTEILAVQHYETFVHLAEKMMPDLKISLITGKNKKIIAGSGVIIGTHALLNKRFEDLALVVIDEQQRFGVVQRNLILSGNKTVPHYLSLSATPIPRSLAHVVFQNCDLSVIKQKPKGRAQVKTYLVPESKRFDSYKFINSLLEKGQQAFVICPLINPNDLTTEKKSVELEKNKIEKIFNRRKIGVLHGRLSSSEKIRVMTEFKDKLIDILICTSLVEVGIDVPNATVMVIEDADSFGLSQLHQFRGRVGRGKLSSYCLIFSNKLANVKTKQRLSAFVRSDDGFELANQDLILRGPGAFFDQEQSGFHGINPLWFEDSSMLKDAIRMSKKFFLELDSYTLLKKIILDNSKIDRLE